VKWTNGQLLTVTEHLRISRDTPLRCGASGDFAGEGHAVMDTSGRASTTHSSHITSAPPSMQHPGRLRLGVGTQWADMRDARQL
jgi:hypothetical protein